MLRLNCLLAACVLTLAINVGAADATGHGAGGWHGAGGRHFVGRHHDGRHFVGRHRDGKRHDGLGVGAFGGGYYGCGYYGDGYYGCGYDGVGAYGTPNYSNEPVGSVSQPQPFPATYALDCPPSEEIVTVPSEHGPGEVKVRILYGTGTKCRPYAAPVR
jgi:hypothetical protein